MSVSSSLSISAEKEEMLDHALNISDFYCRIIISHYITFYNTRFVSRTSLAGYDISF